jgi:hypothetical protein
MEASRFDALVRAAGSRRGLLGGRGETGTSLDPEISSRFLRQIGQLRLLEGRKPSVRGVFQHAGSSLQRHLGSSRGQLRKDAWPKAGGAPASVPLVGRLPLAVFRWHRPPRGVGAHHPEDAGEDGPMVMARSSGRGLLGREQRLNPAPLGVGQLHLGGCGRRSSAGGRCGRSAERVPRGMTARGNRLMGSAPARPREPEGPLRRGVAQGQDQPAHLRHRERDQARIGPPFSSRSSCWAA